MRATIIIAGHNEGGHIVRTIESVFDSVDCGEFEVIVSDDCSTDGSIDACLQRFSQISIVKGGQRQGPSPTKDRGAQAAAGEVLIFLDGHCHPEPGALVRLIEDVERSAGASIFVPRIAPLDTVSWRNHARSAGDGYALNLQKLDTHWTRLAEMRPVGPFFESPALIGCCFAVSRPLYWRLWGFDPHMFEWGVEDIDFGLKAWLLGHSILVDRTVTIGHRFQKMFNRYSVSHEHILANQMRMVRKCFSEENCSEWIRAAKTRHSGPVWNRANEIYERNRPSVERERAYLHSLQVRDECDYACHFGLDWPIRSGHATSSTQTMSAGGVRQPLLKRSATSRSPRNCVFAPNLSIPILDGEERRGIIQLRIERDLTGTVTIQNVRVDLSSADDELATARRIADEVRGHPVYWVRQMPRPNFEMARGNTESKEGQVVVMESYCDLLWDKLQEALAAIGSV